MLSNDTMNSPRMPESPDLHEDTNKRIRKLLTRSQLVVPSEFQSPDKVTLTLEEEKVRYDLKEYMLMRAYMTSSVCVILLVVLVYFLLFLLGEYLSVILFAVIVSKALRSTKLALSQKLGRFVGIIDSNTQKKYYFMNSWCLKILIELQNLFLCLIRKRPWNFILSNYIRLDRLKVFISEIFINY